MGTMRRSVIVTCIAACVLIVAYFGVRALSAMHQGYTWREMDWDQDGTTSLKEFLAASDIGERDLVKNGGHCRQFYSYRTGCQLEPTVQGSERSGQTRGDEQPRITGADWLLSGARKSCLIDITGSTLTIPHPNRMPFAGANQEYPPAAVCRSTHPPDRVRGPIATPTLAKRKLRGRLSAPPR